MAPCTWHKYAIHLIYLQSMLCLGTADKSRQLRKAPFWMESLASIVKTSLLHQEHASWWRHNSPLKYPLVFGVDGAHFSAEWYHAKITVYWKGQFKRRPCIRSSPSGFGYVTCSVLLIRHAIEALMIPHVRTMSEMICIGSYMKESLLMLRLVSWSRRYPGCVLTGPRIVLYSRKTWDHVAENRMIDFLWGWVSRSCKCGWFQ